MSFRSTFYVTSYFAIFDWKNLQNERLYTLIPVPITCTLTTKICPFIDLHITLDIEQIHYCWAAKKYLMLATANSKSDSKISTTTVLEGKVTQGAISNCI